MDGLSGVDIHQKGIYATYKEEPRLIAGLFCMCQEAEGFFSTTVIDTDKDGSVTMRVAHLLHPHRIADMVEEPIACALIGFSNQYRTVLNYMTTFSAFHHNLLKEQE